MNTGLGEADARAAVRLFALDPMGAGLVVRGGPSDARAAILAAVAEADPALRVQRVPLHASIGRLVGQTDLGASLAAGRRVDSAGLLEARAPTVLVLTMAERWEPGRAALVASALDTNPALGLIALDEGEGADEALHPRLADRCALHIDVGGLAAGFLQADGGVDAQALARARDVLPGVRVAEAMITALCQAAAALGIGSMRAVVLAVRCARGVAALAGRAEVEADDAAVAARLVFSARATRVPEAAEAEAAAEMRPDDERVEDASGDGGAGDFAVDGKDGAQEEAPGDLGLNELVLEAAAMSLPAGLLAQAGAAVVRRMGAAAPGQAGAGARVAAPGRGRPVGSRAGSPRDGRRLDLAATLQAAAPWQGLRGRRAGETLRLRGADLRVVHCKPRQASLTIFAVDASGSLALARLADAKGAVELLLADCYVRRDMVALIAFRGAGASLLLPPTRAPARARRCLAGLPGGGGTPLVCGIDAASALAAAARRRGETPTIVLLTDGQGNVARDGSPGRVAAQAQAMQAAADVRAAGHRALLIDTAPRRVRAGGTASAAQVLAGAMDAHYIALPQAGAEAVSAAVRVARR